MLKKSIKKRRMINNQKNNKFKTIKFQTAINISSKGQK